VTELVQGGKRQRHLGLDPAGVQDSDSRREALGVPQQCRFPDPGLTANNEYATLARSQTADELLQPGTFGGAPDEDLMGRQLVCLTVTRGRAGVARFGYAHVELLGPDWCYPNQ
jgi:hypothetical protein